MGGNGGRCESGKFLMFRLGIDRCFRRQFDVRRRNPAVAATVDGSNEDWILGGISERVAQALDGAADSEVEIDEHVIRPQRLAKFLVRNDFVGTAQQELQRPKRQVLDSDLDSISAQLVGTQVSLEYYEQNDRLGRAIQRASRHKIESLQGRRRVYHRNNVRRKQFCHTSPVFQGCLAAPFQTTTSCILLQINPLARHTYCTNGSRSKS